MDELDPETQTLPPPNTYTVSHIRDHRPSILTPPTAPPTASASASVDPSAFDYLTVWLGYESEDTWEPRSSFWDEWKVSEYWKGRRHKAAQRDGWGKQRAEEEEAEEKQRVVGRWREYWADEPKQRPKKNGRRGTGVGGAKRKKRQAVDAEQPPAVDTLAGHRQEGGTEADGGVAQEDEEEVVEDQPAAKRQRTISSRTPTRRTNRRFTRQTENASQAEETDEVEEVAIIEPAQQTPQTAPSTLGDDTAFSSTKPRSPPLPIITARPSSPPVRSRPPSPPPTQAAFSTAPEDSDSAVPPPPRLHSPPPAVAPPSPVPRRSALSSTLAVVLPAAHSTLAAPRVAASFVASDDDTIPTTSQPDDDDLALTPVAVTVSSSISFERQTTGESDVEEVEGDGKGRRRVRFNEQLETVQLTAWEEVDETEEMDMVNGMQPRLLQRSEEVEAEASPGVQSQPARQPLLSRKARDYLDRTYGKSVTQRAGEANVHKQRHARQKEKLGGRDELLHNNINHRKHFSVPLDEHMDAAVAITPGEQKEPAISTEAVVEEPSVQTEGKPAEEQSGSDHEPVSAAAVVMAVQQADEVEQPIAQLAEPSLTLPTPAQQLVALPPSPTASNYDEVEDDASEQAEEEENQFTVEAIVDKAAETRSHRVSHSVGGLRPSGRHVGAGGQPQLRHTAGRLRGEKGQAWSRESERRQGERRERAECG